MIPLQQQQIFIIAMRKQLKYNLKAIMADKSISQDEICQVCRVSRQTVYRWMNILMDSDQSIPADDLRVIASYLDVTMEDLFKKQDEVLPV